MKKWIQTTTEAGVKVLIATDKIVTVLEDDRSNVAVVYCLGEMGNGRPVVLRLAMSFSDFLRELTQQARA